MGERTQYTPGTFCWVDLTTTDQAAAKAFYGGLFGWEAEDMATSDDRVYSLMRRDGKDVAAIAGQPAELTAAGIPPAWNSYVSVESADDTARRAQELGASLFAAPFDVLDAGRMAVIQDPQGAVVIAWQPKQHIGAGLVNAPGALCWNELASPDLDASSSFYSALFGWEIEPFEPSPQPYLSIKNGDSSNGGITVAQPPGTPPHWLPYFAVEDVDQGLARVAELGGSTLAGPIDIEIARIGVVADPQGAALTIYAGQLDP